MSVKQIFDEIANESSTNKKIEILSKYKTDNLLKDVLYLANSNRIKFYIKQIPTYIPSNSEISLRTQIDRLSDISDRIVTGHQAIELLSTLLSDSIADDAYIIERIIEKDCKIGMGTSNINKVFPKLIEDTPYMGARAFDEKLAKKIIEDGPAYSQIKMDGRYCNAIITNNEVDLESRQGEPTVLTGAKFLTELSQLSDCVLNGELTMEGVSRYESNGIIASLISINKKLQDHEAGASKEVKEFERDHMPFKKALDSIIFTAWDVISIEEYLNAKSDVIYEIRFDNLINRLATLNATHLRIVSTRLVDSYDWAILHFQDALKNGEEGTILKSRLGTWKDTKPNSQVKMKLEMDVDLKIVGFNFGTGKNLNLISSISAESSDGKVFTKPTGISEKMMTYITANQEKLLGTILEVKCSGLSHNSDGNYSLLHPVFKALRIGEKDEADSLEAIKYIEDMVKGLKVV